VTAAATCLLKASGESLTCTGIFFEVATFFDLLDGGIGGFAAALTVSSGAFSSDAEFQNLIQ
jgi:hypothetical protein